MQKLKFVFGNHNHQPTGNFDSVFEEAVEKAYKPFINVLRSFPGLKMSLHFSGCLLEWLDAHQPELLDEVATLVGKGQIEILSSGFYEPVLSAIPQWDRLRQLTMMNEYIQARFGTKPRGAWMTERVWESHVVDSLVETEIDYVVIDDYHFKCAGITEETLSGYYTTENNGSPLSVLPIRENLRYTIPFSDPSATIQELRNLYDRGQRLAVMIDDGEKFGLWPGTYKLSYQERWLERFFEALQNESHWLEMALPSEVLDSATPTGMVYLPSASYFEMSEWSLPGDKAENFSTIVHELQDNGQIERFRPFLRGGIWRNFFMKYPESNNMHKRMLDLSKQIEDESENSPESQNLMVARKKLLTAQCNCAYWHGVFGGLYLPHLRDAVYRNLIEADKLLHESKGLQRTPILRDINLDGIPEVELRSESVTAIVAPQYGGALYELDFVPRLLNLLNTLASRQEGYHAEITKNVAEKEATEDTASIHDIKRGASEQMKQELVYDWHNRYSFLDHFLPSDCEIEHMRSRSFLELGDCINTPYQAFVESDVATLKRDATISIFGQPLPIHIVKAFRLTGGELKVTYQIQNTSDKEIYCLFAPELNFSMLGGSDTEISYFSGKWSKQKMVSAGERPSANEFGIQDARKGITIRLETKKAARFWFFPSRTVSQSEKGFELNYQSSVILPVIDLKIKPGETFENEFTLNIQPQVHTGE
jgi:alpha-amylase/alpha-mannosidase (GH57 family)